MVRFPPGNPFPSRTTSRACNAETSTTPNNPRVPVGPTSYLQPQFSGQDEGLSNYFRGQKKTGVPETAISRTPILVS